MFTNRRPPPKTTTSSSSTLASSPRANSSSTLPIASTSTSTPLKTTTTTTTTTVKKPKIIQTKVQTVVKTVTRPIVLPSPRPKPLLKKPTTSNAKKRSNGESDDGESSTNSSHSKRRAISSTKKPTTSSSSNLSRSSFPATTTKHGRSSSLSSLSDSEGGGYESSSSLSSADEDYFSGKLSGSSLMAGLTSTSKREEGQAVCVRDVAADPLPQGTTPKFKVVSSEEIVKSNLSAYRLDYFVDPANPESTTKDWTEGGEDIPVVELEYPAVGAKERFALLAPKRNDEYNPIEDLMVTIETILSHFLTPQQSLEHFGYTPGSSFSSFASFLKPLSSSHGLNHSTSSSIMSRTNSKGGGGGKKSRSNSPALHHHVLPNPPTPRISTPEPTSSTSLPIQTTTTNMTNGTLPLSQNGYPSLHSLLNPSSSSSSNLSSSSTSTITTTTTTAQPQQTSNTTPVEPLLRALEKARNRRDGPTFLSHIQHFNQTLLQLKTPPTPTSTTSSSTTTTTTTTTPTTRTKSIIQTNISNMRGLREKVWTKAFYQCYDRIVGPDIEELRRYEAFSDNVYGELLPKFMNEIFEKTQLGPGKVFVDLGSGVGNCVVQAALATGADSYGFENMPHASHLARLQISEAQERFKMWGIKGGKEMKVFETDFCESDEVPKILKKADVVLVNNEVFTASLNDKLAYLFLDLPDHCHLVSLKPFLAPTFKLSSHNLNHPLAYLSQGPPLQYRPGSVSWKMEGGTYYVAKVERGRLERWVRKEEEKEEGRKRKREEMRSRSMSRSNSRN